MRPSTSSRCPTCRIHTEFDEQISLFDGHIKQAKDNLVEIELCIKALKVAISKEMKVIGRENESIGRLKTRRLKETLLGDSDPAKLAAIDGEIDQLRASIEASAETIANSLGSIVGCEKLRDAWRKAVKDRKTIFYELKARKRRGMRGEAPAECRRKTRDGSPCQNAKQYLVGKWVACEDHL